VLATVALAFRQERRVFLTGLPAPIPDPIMNGRGLGTGGQTERNAASLPAERVAF